MESNPLFYLFIVLTFLLAFSYFVGARRNKKLGGVVFKILEEAFSPAQKSYTNIGGLIGYNFRYKKLKPKKFSSANGVLTLKPRQSPLYLPFATLLGHGDKLRVSLYCAALKNNAAVWQIVNKKGAKKVDQVADQQVITVQSGSKSFCLSAQREEDLRFWQKKMNAWHLKYLQRLEVNVEQGCFYLELKPHNFFEELKEVYAALQEWVG